MAQSSTAMRKDSVLIRLSKDLSIKYNKGFGRRNVFDMRRFYLAYQKWQTVSAKLSWSHYIKLIALSNDKARGLYEKQCIHENWSVRELERQVDASLFERLALSKNKKGVMALSKKETILLIYTKLLKTHTY